MPSNTGTICENSGLYRSSCEHVMRISILENEIFPPCLACNSATTWSLAQMTSPISDEIPQEPRPHKGTQHDKFGNEYEPPIEEG